MHHHSRCWKYSGDQDKVIAPMLGNLKFIPNEIRRLKAEETCEGSRYSIGNKSAKKTINCKEIML